MSRSDIEAHWGERVPFVEVIDFQEGPGILAKDFRDEGVPLIRLAGLNRGASIADGCNYLDPATVQRRWEHFRLREGDILLSTSASLGRIATVRKDGVGAIPYTGIIRMRPRDERIKPSFLPWLLRSRDFQLQVESMGAGSVIRHFGPMHLKQMTVLLPPLGIQQTISEILGALDDKIELNRKMNATLDELARTIFRSWFVDFDPVRAKMEGREPFGMDAETAALFPDMLVDSSIGAIPEGWDVKALDEISDFLNGLALQKYPPRNDDSDLPVIKIAQLRVNSTASSDKANSDVPAKYVIEDGDFLFSWSGSLIADIWTGGCGALNQHLFKVTSDVYPQWFVYHWVQEHIDHFRSIAADKATTMGHINRRHLSEANCAVPRDDRLFQAGAEAIEELMALSSSNDLESRTLAELRDTLLPELISGRIRVPEAEKVVAEVV